MYYMKNHYHGIQEELVLGPRETCVGQRMVVVGNTLIKNRLIGATMLLLNESRGMHTFCRTLKTSGHGLGNYITLLIIEQ